LRNAELRIGSPHGIGIHGDAFLNQRAERRRTDGDGVFAGLQVVDDVGAAFVGDRMADDSGRGVQGFDLGVGHGCASGIADVAGQRAVEHLTARVGGLKHRKDNRQRHGADRRNSGNKQGPERQSSVR